jgi:hypothetical protein
MIALVCFIWSVLTTPFKSNSELEAENAALRHQLVVLQRKVRGRIEFTNGDRLFFILLYRWCPQGNGGRSARDRGTLASGWLSSLLALEIAGPAAAHLGRL